jgi:hypothetical protein
MHNFFDLPPSNSESDSSNVNDCAKSVEQKSNDAAEPLRNNNPGSDAPTEIEVGGDFLDSFSSEDDKDEDEEAMDVNPVQSNQNASHGEPRVALGLSQKSK